MLSQSSQYITLLKHDQFGWHETDVFGGVGSATEVIQHHTFRENDESLIRRVVLSYGLQGLADSLGFGPRGSQKHIRAVPDLLGSGGKPFPAEIKMPNES